MQKYVFTGHTCKINPKTFKILEEKDRCYSLEGNNALSHGIHISDMREHIWGITVFSN